MPVDVQTIVQVFYPNLHYYETNEPVKIGITIESILTDTGAWAVYYENGEKLDSFFFSAVLPFTVKENKRVIKGSIYSLLKRLTGIRPQWGFITGVRPAKTITELLNKGYTDDECLDYFIKGYDALQQKAELSLEVSKAERDILSNSNDNDISIYIGIPFCPSRCLYCSFTSFEYNSHINSVEPYLEALIKELNYIAQVSKGFNIKSIYIGGGTPTSLSEKLFEQLLFNVERLFPIKQGVEYTVEAGRPDTITTQKLKLLKAYGVNRISINPQTMNDGTLKAIGRKHLAQDVRRVFLEARELGHDNINMDLILGLPGETKTQVSKTMEEIAALDPDNITVHTLAVKRASRLKETFDLTKLTNTAEMEKMLEVSEIGARLMGMKPYYMYRQKNMVGNFENVGYAKPGKQSYYNVQIMEETQTILAAGAGASTKVVFHDENRIERAFNVKSLEDYIERIDEMILRKQKLLDMLTK